MGKFPVPIVSFAHASYRGIRYLAKGIRFVPSPMQIASIAAQEIGFSMGNIIWQYRSANAHIDEHAHVLSHYITSLRKDVGITNVSNINYMKKLFLING